MASKENNSDENEDIGEEVRVNFVLDPSMKDRSLEVPSEPIAIPSQTRRKGLSAIINHLLGRKVEKTKNDGESDDDDSSSSSSDDDDDDEDKLDSIDFDFLIKEKFLLRTGVETAARRYGISLEESIKIIYFPAQEAPEESGEGEPIPDWISAMEILKKGKNNNHLLATAGYDGNLRLHARKKSDNDGDKSETGGFLETITSNKVHEGPIKCLAATTANTDDYLIATGSLDHTLVAHRYNLKSSSLQGHAKYVNGHKSSIVSVDFSPKNSKFLISGDWNGSICLWKTFPGDSNVSEEAPVKKHKGNSSSSSTSTLSSINPESIIPTAHSSQISGILWNHKEQQQVITGSWDHSVKVWDLESSDCLLTLNGSRVVTCLDLALKSPVVATGHPDCNIRLWDIRSQEQQEASIVADSSLRPSHKAYISAVKWSPKDPYILASTSHDGTIKLWDIRSSLPLHTIRAHPKTEKSLCLAFGYDIIYAGGTDCIVKQYTC